MKISIAKYDSMGQTGRSLLRLMQNNTTSILDLLVRESIQNSLDACKDDVSTVNVDYIVSDVETQKFARYFEGVDLNSRFAGNYKILGIRDSNTVGLEGPISRDDVEPRHDMGRFINLVYEICKAQEKMEAGGSWGMGKTIYYRVGVGIVLFYTRIKTSKGYESRLAAVCVEDESRDDGSNIIQYAPNVHPRGIAWWGDIKNGNPVPVTDEKEIAAILDAMGIPLYKGSETGTTIIIPFVDDNHLLNDVINNEAEYAKWTDDLSWYFEIAIQRWYAPRLNNKSYPYGPSLHARVVTDGEAKEITMLPFFKLIQDLYNAAPTDGKKSTGNAFFEYGDKKIPIVSKDINVQKDLTSQTAGYLNHIKLTDNDLVEINSVHITEPFFCIQNTDNEEKENPVIFAFVRKPGMIMSYCTPGEWCANVPCTPKGEYVVALFVANSKNYIAEKPDMSLEEYYRQSEEADHLGWVDNKLPGLNHRLTLISKVKKNVNQKLKEYYAKDDKKEESGEPTLNKRLGKCLADILLPSTLKATKPGTAKGHGKGKMGVGGEDYSDDYPEGTISRKRGPVLKVTGGPYFKKGSISIDISVLMNGCSHAQIVLNVETEQKSLTLEDWNSKLQLPFPGGFKSGSIDFSVYERKVNKREKVKDVSEYTMEYSSSVNGSDINDIVDIYAPTDNQYIFKTSLIYEVSPDIRFDIKIKEVTE